MGRSDGLMARNGTSILQIAKGKEPNPRGGIMRPRTEHTIPCGKENAGNMWEKCGKMGSICLA